MRPFRLLTLAVALAACRTAQPMAWPNLNREFLADAGATYNFRLGLPTVLAVTRDGAVIYRRTPAREFVADLYELDTRTGAVKTLATAADLLGTGEEHLSDEEKARRERSRTIASPPEEPVSPRASPPDARSRRPSPPLRRSRPPTP